MLTPHRRLWLARLLIGLVFFINVQCAVLFLIWPEIYAPGFEVAGIPGRAAVQGMGILFLMWNVPYAFALWHPRRFNLSLWQAVIMQAVGAAGETLLWLNLPADYPLLSQSILRFILFDSAGLLLLLLSALVHNHQK